MLRLVFLTALAVVAGGCSRRQARLGPGGEMAGGIRAGETVRLAVDVAAGHVANLLVHQHEIDVAVEADGVISDSTEFDHESIPVAAGGGGGAVLKISASREGPRNGRYRVWFVSQQPVSERTRVALEATRIEARGREALDLRRAESLPSAAEDLRLAAEMWGRTGDERREAYSLWAAGIAQERMGRYAQADQMYLRAMQSAKAAGEPAGYRMVEKSWLNLGGRLGEERAGIAEMFARLESARRVGDRRLEAVYVRALATAHAKAKNYAEDEAWRHSYLALAKQMEDPTLTVDALGRLGGFLWDRKRYGESLQFAEEMLRLARRMGNEGEELGALHLIALTSGAAGDVDFEARAVERLKLFHQRRGDRTGELAATIRLGGLRTRQGRPAEGWAEFESALKDRVALRRSSGSFGEHFVAPGDGDFAISLAQLAAKYPEYGARAFAAADRARGLFLADGPESAEALHGALGAKATLAEWAANPQSANDDHVWLAADGRIESVALGIRGQTMEAIEAVVQSLSDARASLRDSEAVRKRLAAQYLGPLKGRLKTQQVVIVPDESMIRIPFAVLPDPDHDDGSLLGEHHLVSYAPSGQAIAALRSGARGASDGSVLVAADPVTALSDSRHRSGAAAAPEPGDWTATARSAGVLVGGSQLPRLVFSAAEARDIERALGGRRVVKLLGFDASKRNVRQAMAEADIVHLASHGLADLKKPGASGLAFSFWDRSGESRDGFLNLEEIAGAKMAARLVTLSACDTSVGRVLWHYGVPNLSNAFLRAGARRVVSTLWKVDDAATAALMARFYRELFSGGNLLPAEALWRAQMEIRKQPRWSAPYYWAGFVLSGDWGPM